MATIVETAVIDADIEAVFGLISAIDEFPLYARFLSVRKLDERTYEWVARAHGLSVSWASVITDCEPPVRLAWKSVRGLPNAGTYTLASSPRGTIVSLEIEYHLPGELLEKFTAPIAARLLHALAAEVLAAVQRHFAHDRTGKRAKVLA